MVIANFLLIGVLWGILFYPLSYEWGVNEQYQYGFFIPILGTFLLYLRWQDAPQCQSTTLRVSSLIGLFFFIGLFLILPLKVVFAANVDWRLVIWAQAGVTFLLTMYLVDYWGGAAWRWHFFPALLFFLFGLPWPSRIALPLVQGLMNFSAAATVEAFHWIGIYAKQLGNVIEIKTGTLHVEEACSGVRSFQSTLMMAYFLGEMKRLCGPARIGLLVLGAAVALFFNLCRTFALTGIGELHGIAAVDKWHDVAGYSVFALSFGALVFLACLLGRREEIKQKKTALQVHYLPLKSALCLAFGLFLFEPVTHLWYAWRSPAPVQASWGMAMDRSPYPLWEETIPSQMQKKLHYDEGRLFHVRISSTQTGLVYFLKWHSGRAAQLGGVHTPDDCLAAVGWSFLWQGKEFVWKRGIDGVKLVFNTYAFTNGQGKIYVFFCQWDPSGYPYYLPMRSAYAVRLADAWRGNQKGGKQNLEIAFSGFSSLAEAKVALATFLKEVIE